MKKLLLLFQALLLMGNLIFAEYSQVCNAKYMRQSGWSDNYNVEVNFLTGSELNNATRSFGYEWQTVYAVIFWDEGEATVIKLSSFLTCGTEVTRGCISTSSGKVVGTDKNNVKWEICLTNFCF